MTYPLKYSFLLFWQEKIWKRICEYKKCELLAFCHQIQIVCKCAQKRIMENEIVRFDGLNHFS
jgi:hypothetical protein